MTTGSRPEPGTCPVGHSTAQASSRSVTRTKVTTGSTTGVSAREAMAAVPALSRASYRVPSSVGWVEAMTIPPAPATALWTPSAGVRDVTMPASMA